MPVQPTQARHGFRTAAKVLAIVLGSLIGLVVVAVLTALLIARSEWGRRKILAIAVPLAQEQLNGELQVGALEGSLVSTLALRDLELKDPEGHVAARIQRVAVRYRLLALFGRTLDVTSATVEGAQAHIRFLKDGRLNVAALVKPSDTPPSKDPLPIRIRVNGIDVDLAADAQLDRPGQAAPPAVKSAAARIRLHAGLELRRDRSIYGEVEGLTVQTADPLAAEVTLRAKVSMVPTPKDAPADQPPSVTVHELALGLRTQGDEVNRMTPPTLKLDGPLGVDVKVDGTLENLAAQIDLKLPAGVNQQPGQGHIEARVGLLDKKLPWKLQLALTGLDPSALRRDLPPAQISLGLSGEGNGASGHLNLKELLVKLGPNTVRVSGTVDAPVQPPVWQDPLAARAEILVDVGAPDLDALTHIPILKKLGAPPITGSLSGTVRAELAGRSLRTHVGLLGLQLRGFGAEIGRLRFGGDTVNLAGGVQLAVDRVAAGGQRFANIFLNVQGGQDHIALSVEGNGPQDTHLKLALQARPQTRPGTGLGGQDLIGLVTEIRELVLDRHAAKLQLQTPAVVQLTELHTKSPIVDVGRFQLALADQVLTLGAHFETGPKRLRATADAQRIDLQKLGRVLTGHDQLPKSRIDLHAEAAGTLENPSVQLSIKGELGQVPKVLPWQTSHAISVSLRNHRASGSIAVKAIELPQDAPLGPSVRAQFELPVPASGSTGLPGGPINLQLDAETSFAQLRPLLPPDLQQKQLNGSAALAVTLKGTMQRPDLALRLGLPVWEFEQLRGENTELKLTYAKDVLQASLDGRALANVNHPGAVGKKEDPALGGVHLEATVPLPLDLQRLPKMKPDALIQQLTASALALKLDLRDLALPQLLRTALVGLDNTGEPLLRTGTAALHLEAAGPLNAASLSANLDTHNVSVAPQPGMKPIELAAAMRLGYRGDKLALALMVNGTKGSPLAQTAEAAQADLAPMPWLLVRGTTQFSVAEVLADAKNLVQRLPLRAAVDLNLDSQSLPPELPMKGQLVAVIKATGTVATPLIDAKVHGTKVVAAAFPIGDIDLKGSLDATRVIRAQLQIVQSSADKQAGRPADAKAARGSLQLKANVPLPLNLESEATKIELMAQSFRIDYQAPLGAGPLHHARGLLSSGLTVQGAKGQPNLDGSLQLREGEILLTALAQPIESIELDLGVKRSSEIELQRLTAKSGGGRLHVSGKVQLAGSALRNVAIAASTTRFPLAAGPIGLWLDSNVHLTGEPRGDTLHLKVDIPDGVVHLPKLEPSGSVQSLEPLEDVRFVDAAALRMAAASERKAQATAAQEEHDATQGKATPFLPERTQVAVSIPGFAVSGPEVKAVVLGNLEMEVGKRTPVPVITGEIHTEPGGSIEVLNRRYHIERAQVSLTGEVPPNPILNVEISRKLEDTTIYLSVTGTPRRPVVGFRSDPPMDQSQIIAMVLSGSNGGSKSSVQSKAVGAISGLIVGQIKDQLGSALPIDVIRLDVGGNDSTGVNQTSMELGKYLRDDLYLAYTIRFGNPSTILRRFNNHQAAIEWSFLANYQLQIMGGDMGVGALNLYWSKHF